MSTAPTKSGLEGRGEGNGGLSRGISAPVNAPLPKTCRRASTVSKKGEEKQIRKKLVQGRVALGGARRLQRKEEGKKVGAGRTSTEKESHEKHETRKRPLD